MGIIQAQFQKRRGGVRMNDKDLCILFVLFILCNFLGEDGQFWPYWPFDHFPP